MAVSIAELIEQKETIAQKKAKKYDLTTSIGIITVTIPTKSFVAEVLALENADEYLILNQVVEPDLKDSQLQKAYGCGEPMDIVNKLFLPGEIIMISKKILECAGYNVNIQSALHDEAKN